MTQLSVKIVPARRTIVITVIGQFTMVPLWKFRLDYDSNMPGSGRLRPFSKLGMVVLVLLFTLIFALVRLGLLHR